MSEKLKPCPFCNGDAEIINLTEGENAGGSCVCCTRCQASGNVEFGRKENFVSNWNTRSQPPRSEGWREEVARIIDHEGYWERLDNLNAAMRLGLGTDEQFMELCHVRDEELAGTEESLTKADQIAALHPPLMEGDVVEAVYASLEKHGVFLDSSEAEAVSGPIARAILEKLGNA